MTLNMTSLSEIEPSALICAYLFDGQGQGKELDLQAVNAWSAGDGPLWVHLDCQHADTEAWLREHANLDSVVVEGLLADETRPRCDVQLDGLLLILRGVNLNPDAAVDDMVSIRLWIDGHRVVSTRIRRLKAIDDIRSQIANGRAPLSAAHFAARLAWHLAERMEPVVQNLNEQMDEIEDKLDRANEKGHVELRDIRHPLLELRRVTISLRRYLAPQRVAISTFAQLDEGWIDERIKGRLREATDRTIRITEELDEIRERSIVVQDELANRISHRMEKTMYVLTIVATIMLPLGFLTGLLGINVGGIPGAETSWAFWAVCAGLASLVAIEVWIFRRMGWL